MDSCAQPLFRNQTNASQKIQFLFFLAVSLLLAICLLMPGKVMAQNATPVENTELGKFKILPKTTDKAFTLDIQHDGKSIIKSNDPVKMISYDEIQKDVPLPGCETLKVNLSTDSESSYYLLTSCKDKDFAAYIKPFKGNVTFNPELKTYTATDPFFVGYSAKLLISDDAIAFTPEESPIMTRALVFKDGAWRNDKIKEFVEFYTDLQKQAQGEAAKATAPQSVKIAYYACMTGVPRIQSGTLFKEILPPEHTIMADQIYSDIQKAIREFKIVENLALDEPKS